MAVLRIVPVTHAPWADVERVFGTRGDPADCWCQWFKLSDEQRRTLSRSANATRLKQQAAAPPGPGLLAYLDDEPVAWCGVEPGSSYPRIASANDDSVWAVTCFVVRVGYRKRGLGRQLALAAVDHARANGARALEAYPTDAAGRNLRSADLYRGTASMFEAAGFTETERLPQHRVVMRVELRRR
jgi:GNAT superfamily N-acetyltransferase